VDAQGSAVLAADQFRLEKYVVPPSAALHVQVPKEAPERSIAAMAGEIGRLPVGSRVTVVPDATQSRPTHVISWDGDSWILERYPSSGVPERLGGDPKAEDMRRRLPADAKVLLVLPPSPP